MGDHENENESRTYLAINGHEFTAVRRWGKWTITCSWPDLAEKYRGTKEPYDAITEFTQRALAECIKVTVIAVDKGK